jgi:TolB-like protein
LPQLLVQRADGCNKSAETLGIGAPAGWFQAANRGLLRWRDVPPGRRQAGLWDINAESWGIPIVVLPFANLSKDPEQQYFADAITDDLTTDLSRISGSFVIAATTAFTYKGKGLGANQIGHELGVRYVLEGSVRHTGDHVQVNVQLIDGESGAHLWADRFESHRANVAKAQSEITGRLARTLNLELAEAVGRRVEQDGSIEPTYTISSCVGGPRTTGPLLRRSAKRLCELSNKR